MENRILLIIVVVVILILLLVSIWAVGRYCKRKQ